MGWSCTPAYNNDHVCNLGGKKCCHRFGHGRKKLFALQFASELISFRDIFSTILYCWLLIIVIPQANFTSGTDNLGLVDLLRVN